MHIIYVDDKPEQDIIRLLETLGAVTILDSLQSLKEEMKKSPPDILVMDVRIPQQSGSQPDLSGRGLIVGMDYKVQRQDMVVVFVTAEPRNFHFDFIDDHISTYGSKRIGYLSKYSNKDIGTLIKFLIEFNDNHLVKEGILPSDNQKLKEEVKRLFSEEEKTILKYMALGMTYETAGRLTSLNVNNLLTSVRRKLKQNNIELELFDPLLGEKCVNDDNLFLGHLARFLELSWLEFNVSHKSLVKKELYDKQ